MIGIRILSVRHDIALLTGHMIANGWHYVIARFERGRVLYNRGTMGWHDNWTLADRYDHREQAQRDVNQLLPHEQFGPYHVENVGDRFAVRRGVMYYRHSDGLIRFWVEKPEDASLYDTMDAAFITLEKVLLS